MQHPSFLQRSLLVLSLLLIGLGLANPLAAAPLPRLPDQQDGVQQLQAGPDLIIQSITLNPANPAPGSQADVTVVVKNQGDAAVALGQKIELRIYVEAADDPPTVTTPVTKLYTHAIGLAVGDTFEYAITGQPIAQANPKVYAWVDRDNLITEGDEANNLFPPPAPPVTPDGFEQDDSCATAQEIALDGAVQDHNLAREGGVADADWVKFTAQSGVKYVVRADAIGADAKLTLELYATCDSPPSFGAGAAITFTAPAAGVYFINVHHDEANYGPATDYKLKANSLQALCTRALEPNDICGVASDLAINTSAQTLAFCDASDTDWMRIPVKAGGQYTLTAQNVGQLANVQLSVFPSCSEASSGTGQTVKFKAGRGGYVYVQAQNADPNIFGVGTEYTMHVAGTQGCDEDQYEPDNTFDKAQPLRLNGNPQVHTPCGAGDIDWVKADATEGATYTIETLNLGERADTKLCLHDASGKELRCDDDSGPGRGSRITIEGTVAGAYLFSIRDRDPQVAGESARYEVRLISGFCQNDGNESDNTQQTAKAINPDGSLQLHNICAADDADWTSFAASANTDYLIATSQTGAEADTVIELYNGAGVRLAVNDDHAPGVNSQLAYRISDAGTYFVRTYLYNPQNYGTGTEYALSIKAGTPTATPPPDDKAPPTPTATPGPPTGVQTLIVVNRNRVAQLHGDAKANELMGKLNEFAQDADVHGEILRLDNNTEISAAYANWLSDETNVDKANLVTDAIRRVLQTFLQEHEGVKYVVLAGDDRALPFRRVPDGVPQSPEKEYLDVDTTHATGAAIRSNYYMTDDFYVDRQPTQASGHEIYIPDLAIGRLIETPDDMIHTINNFLGMPNGAVQVDNILVTGYDFVNDVAQENCKDWGKAMNNDTSKVACLIDQPANHWTEQQLIDHQLRPNSVFKIQSINGHAFHSGEGVAASSNSILTGAEIVAATLDFGGGLVYTLGCHSGLNVPPNNSKEPIDLAEAFARKGANYIGNTGFGYGLLSSIGLSEKLMRLYTNQLISSADVTMGKALATAKKQYFQQDANFSAYDEKVMQQLIFYGLPMYKITGLQTSGSLGEEFPGVSFEVDPPSLGGEVISRTVRINFQTAIDTGVLSQTDTESGDYLALNGYTSADANEPIQPLHFGSLASSTAPARSVVVLGGDFTVSQVDDPLIGTPVNEYLPRDSNDEAALASGWHPAIPSTIQTINDEATLVTELAQYNPDTDQQWLYSNLQVDVYYSTSTDEQPPGFTVVDGLYDAATKRVAVKVGVVDGSGIKEVILSYIEDERQTTTSLKSIKLSFDASAQKWRGSFPGDANSLFYVQAVDNAGNVATENNKGNYFTPAAGRSGSFTTVYLPLINR